MLAAPLGEFLRHAGCEGQESNAASALIKLVVKAGSLAAAEGTRAGAPRQGILGWAELLADPSAERVFGVNQFEDTRWLRKESLQTALTCIRAALRSDGIPSPDPAPVLAAAEKCGYRWDHLLQALSAGG